jgi:hypothetical protein
LEFKVIKIGRNDTAPDQWEFQILVKIAVIPDGVSGVIK